MKYQYYNSYMRRDKAIHLHHYLHVHPRHSTRKVTFTLVPDDDNDPEAWIEARLDTVPGFIFMVATKEQGEALLELVDLVLPESERFSCV